MNKATIGPVRERIAGMGMRGLSLPERSAVTPSMKPIHRIPVGPVAADLCLIFLSGLVVFSFRYGTEWIQHVLGSVGLERRYAILDEYLVFQFLYASLIVLFCQGQGLYHTSLGRSALDEVLAVGKAVALATLVLTACIYLSGVKSVSRLVVGSAGVYNVISLSAWRIWKRRVMESRVSEGYGVRNVLIVGGSKIGEELARYLEEHKQLGLVVKGFLDGERSASGTVLGGIEDFPRVIRSHFIDEVFITTPAEREVVKKIATEARAQRVDVKVVPDLYDGLGWRAPVEHLGDFPVLALHKEPIPALGLFLKRAMDLMVSAGGLILLSPLLTAVGLAIRLDSPGPVLYRSARVGKKGRKFTCYKFRSMVADADELKEDLRSRNERDGPIFKITNDPRLTRTGRFLRKYSLDELPQIWNVLKGEMSLVGPRPHPVDDYERYTLEHLRRLDVTPGMTGLWQVSARKDPSFEKGMALDLEYIENWDIWMDIKVILLTPLAVLRGQGQ